MIKIEDLKVNETVIIDDSDCQYKVIDVLGNSIIVENEHGVYLNSINRLNKYGYTIKQPKAPKIPEAGNYYETLPKCRVRDIADREWQYARLVHVIEANYPFCVLQNGEFETGIFKYCELIESENE